MKNTGSKNGFDEAIRYYRNARELLARCKVEDDIYQDMKPVQEAFGTAWLSIDKALKAALSTRGLTAKEIPTSWEPLLAAAAKHLAVRNGRFMKLLNLAYRQIHLAGYYHGDFELSAEAKAAFDVARRVIESLSGRPLRAPALPRHFPHPGSRKIG